MLNEGNQFQNLKQHSITLKQYSGTGKIMYSAPVCKTRSKVGTAKLKKRGK